MRAQPQEGERCFGQDRRGKGERRLHDDWRGDVGQHIAPHHLELARANRVGTLHILLLHHRQGGATHNARKLGRIDNPNRQHRGGDAWPQYTGQHNDQNDGREGKHNIHDPANDAIQPATVVAGHQPQRAA